ncbi:MAG: orotidine-5'-phosphate decarboxylase [Thermoplasmata archaeon]|nr:orotidine-5'-phosphate decarboxylase [Thermoplasmata archaeon]
MFRDRLNAAIGSSGSLLCVGLDPDPDHLPAVVPRTPEGVLEFCLRTVEATREHAAAFKPNAAFFEAMGHEGVWVLEEVRRAIPRDRIAILDGKRGDIGNTARMYATAIFDRMGFDAATVSPYLGRESLLPFLERRDRGTFVLCRTSNPTAGEVQNARTGDVPLYIAIARMAAEMGDGNAGLVVGATVPEAIAEVRRIAPAAPLLVPGVGAQGGDLAAPAAASGTGPVLINASRSIIYASGEGDYAEAAGRAAAEMAERIANARPS